MKSLLESLGLLLGTISFDAVCHLLLCRIEQRPPRLDMENYPHLPMAQVEVKLGFDRACPSFRLSQSE